MFRFTCAVLAVAAYFGTPASAAPPSPAMTLQESADVLDDLAAIPLKSIPPSILADARAVAIIPRVIKAGFIIGGRGGNGVIFVRDKSGAWGEPVFVDFGGGSIGFQAGVQSTDVVLVFRTRDSLDRVLEGKGKLTLGADAAIAAGPVGRQAEAGTDAQFKSEVLSYSRSRGLFAGVALDGSVLAADRRATDAFRQMPGPDNARLTEAIRNRLTGMSAPPPSAAPPAAIVPPPPSAPLPPVRP